MKNIRANIDKWYDTLDERWRALPVGKQHQYTLYFFAGYVLLTTGVIAKVWYDTSKSHSDMVIEHIENLDLKKSKSPARLRDSVSIILKNRIYERE